MSRTLKTDDPLRAIRDELVAAAHRRASAREWTLTIRGRAVGILGTRASSTTFAWLASHRGRLRTFMLGGHRLGLYLIWDRKGGELVDRNADDEAAICQLVNGKPGRRRPIVPSDELGGDRHQVALWRLAATSQYLYDTMAGDHRSSGDREPPMPAFAMEKVREAQRAIEEAIGRGQRVRRRCLGGEMVLTEEWREASDGNR